MSLEKKSVLSSPSFEIEDQWQGHVVGIDEVGCGPWAGPVVAAAVLFKKRDVSYLASINDSKKLSEVKRENVYQELTNSPAIVWGVGIVEAKEIDLLSLGKATLLAHTKAFEDLCQKLESKDCITSILIDGIRKPNLRDIPTVMVIKGDQKSYSIAAASIIAKVTRDRIMQKWHQTYPQYGWSTNVGYGTKEHIHALTVHGLTPLHRCSFKPVKLLQESAIDRMSSNR